MAKLSSDGAHLWSTYLGGEGGGGEENGDNGLGIAVDGAGNGWVTGWTASSGWVSGGYDTTFNGGDEDAFVAKLSSDGAHLWSTYLGGGDDDRGYGIAVDGAGNGWVTGGTNSSGWVSGGHDTSYNGGSYDAFVAKLNNTITTAGVTIITHGWQGNWNWVEDAADKLVDRNGDSNTVAEYTMTAWYDDLYYRATLDLESPDNGVEWGSSENTSGHAVIKLDWRDIDGGVAPYLTPTGLVADLVLQLLLGNTTLLAAPLHLIGHSRGGSLMGALAEMLGEHNIWVDQVSFMDPHPMENWPNKDDWGEDTGMFVTENVVFADCYYRKGGVFYPNGETVAGAWNVKLDNSYFDKDLGYELGYGSEHSDVHAWYRGTIPTGSNSVSLESGAGFVVDDVWYVSDAYDSISPFRSRWDIGYNLSLSGGADRPQGGLNVLLGGSGTRQTVTRSGQQWANIGYLNPLENFVEAGDAFSIQYYYDVPTGNSADVYFFLDDDLNPYDGIVASLGSTSVSGTTGSQRTSSVTVPTSVDDGPYYVLGRISYYGQTRYFYADELVAITNAAPVADAGGPYSGNEGSTVTLGASGSYDPDGSIVSYLWDLDNDGQYDDASGETVSFSRTSDGAYTVGVKVTDDDGASDTDFATVTVENVAPTADAGGPYAGEEGNDIPLSASASTDPGNDIVLYEWDLDNDGEYDDATGVMVTFNSAESGTFTVGVRVTDDDGAWDTDSAQVNVADGTEPIPGDANLDDIVNDADAAILATHWQMQEGATWADGDFNGDGMVTDADAAILATHWQEGVERVGEAAALAAAVPVVPGDANRDGVVDHLDAAILAAHWRMAEEAAWGDGDFDGDGRVGDADAAILASNWVTTVARPPVEAAGRVRLRAALAADPLAADSDRDERAGAHDLVLREPERPRAGINERLLGDLALFHEFQQSGGKDRPSKSALSIEAATDLVLAKLGL